MRRSNGTTVFVSNKLKDFHRLAELNNIELPKGFGKMTTSRNNPIHLTIKKSSTSSSSGHHATTSSSIEQYVDQKSDDSVGDDADPMNETAGNESIQSDEVVEDSPKYTFEEVLNVYNKQFPSLRFKRFLDKDYSDLDHQKISADTFINKLLTKRAMKTLQYKFPEKFERLSRDLSDIHQELCVIEEKISSQTANNYQDTFKGILEKMGNNELSKIVENSQPEPKEYKLTKPLLNASELKKIVSEESQWMRRNSIMFYKSFQSREPFLVFVSKLVSILIKLVFPVSKLFMNCWKKKKEDTIIFTVKTIAQDETDDM